VETSELLVEKRIEFAAETDKLNEPKKITACSCVSARQTIALNEFVSREGCQIVMLTDVFLVFNEKKRCATRETGFS
jgi:hypothetical protein